MRRDTNGLATAAPNGKALKMTPTIMGSSAAPEGESGKKLANTVMSTHCVSSTAYANSSSRRCAGVAPAWVEAGHSRPGSEDDGSEDDLEMAVGNLLPFDWSSCEPLDSWCGHNYPVSALAVVAGKHVASVGASHMAWNLLLWDTGGELLWQLVFNTPRSGLSFDPRSYVRPLVHSVDGVAADAQTREGNHGH